MKVVVTGGAGFIGGRLAASLPADEVHVIDDLSLGRASNVPESATFHRGSILDRALLREVFKGARRVYHLAALPSVPGSVDDPDGSHRTNLSGTLEVLLAARDSGVEKVVFAASSSAYGNEPTIPKVETMRPHPESPYAVQKLAGEDYCRVFFKAYGLRTTALRFFNVYGPNQDPNGAYAAVIPKWIIAGLAGDPICVFGDGSKTRDFIFVDDVVEAMRLAGSSTVADGLVINVGNGHPTTLDDLARRIQALTGGRSDIVTMRERMGDVFHSHANVDLARKILDFTPSRNLEAGLAKTIAAFRRD